MRLAHIIADWLYHKSALWMPLRWDWQYVYVMRSRGYFEVHTDDSWPWRWKTGFEESSQ
jgi:hypothetical protein